MFWLSQPPPTANGPEGEMWANFAVTVTTPDGKNETLGPFSSDDVGGSWTLYTLTQIGTYTMECYYPGQTIQDTGDTYQSSRSQKITLTVQQEPLPAYPEYPIPTDYWTRPISSENRNWASIGGNWLTPTYNATYTFGGFNAYTTAPNTAHIVWTKPIAFGGIVGGANSIDYYTGQSYEWKFQPIIINGRLIYNRPLGSSYYDGVECLDLRTGEEIWFQNGSSVSLAQIYDYESPNQHGAIPYLWSTSGTTWTMADAFTGKQILSIAGAPTAGGFFGTIGTKTAYGDDGSLLVYLLDGSNNWLSLWNSSQCIGPASTAGPAAWMWRPPLGGVLNWSTGIMWNVTIPNIPGQSLSKIGSGVLLTTTGSMGVADNVTYAAYSTTDGKFLWQNTFPIAAGSNEGYFGSSNTALYAGVFERYTKSTMQFHGINATTGQEIWVTEPFTNAWAMYDETGAAAYNEFITMAYDGGIHAYDINTGESLWDFYTPTDTVQPYGHAPFYVIGGWAIADGKVFAGTGEHSPNSPLPLDEKLYAVDAFNGHEVWHISGLWLNPAIADGYLIALNGYDLQLYSFGKGPSATTVSAPTTVVPKGTGVLIQGSVTDQSLGQKGTPAISDKDQTAWMEYLHMQKPKPTDAVGVQVKLTAIDPNGNTQDIGIATSDSNGNYGIMWTPPVEGQYKVTATFAGTNSYGSSDATTYFGVSPAGPAASPTTTPTSAPTSTPTASPTVSPSVVPEPEASPSTDIYVIAAVAAVFLRKRK
jgi:hypothetical protein